jgi:tRNA 2-thiouridine synthesizing protein A
MSDRKQSPDQDLVVDCRGMLCPLPIVELGRAFASTSPGQVLTLLADDPAASVDVRAWCRMRGHELVEQTAYDELTTGRPATAYRIRRV